MNDFEKLSQLHEDFNATWAAFNVARHDAGEMISTVAERLRFEQEQHSARVAELERIVQDPNRSETVHRVAGGELSRIRDRKSYATPEEIAAFGELVKQQENAIRDLKQIQQDAKSAIEGASKSIQAIRGEILGNQLMEPAPRWIESQRAEFAKLCEEVEAHD